MFYGPYKCKNKNEIQHFINMAILNEDYISNLSELMGVIKVDFLYSPRFEVTIQRQSMWLHVKLYFMQATLLMSKPIITARLVSFQTVRIKSDAQVK